ncbi:MAG TPA: hypothetical protein VLM79_22150 [Kofleriaceae bacterium]|nr:hypothetical protein [Kofleriaceae bacterium]
MKRGRALRRLRLLAPWLALWLAACGESGGSSSWKLLASEQPAALLSVWGTTADNVWVVGGRSELAGAPTILHRSGGAWTRVDSNQRGIDLWWVFGFDGGDVYFTGSGGAILRYRNAQFERMVTPRTGTIFGLWGASPDDLWAVGSGDDNRGIVWHYDGIAWTDAAVPAGVPGLVLKVHGQRSNDVWISCASGVTLHWDGAQLTRVDTGTGSSLFSIVTTPDVVIAVGGGPGVGEIFEHTATGWTAQPQLVPVAWRGVAAGNGVAYAVGEAGVVAHRVDGLWSIVQQDVTQLAFHAAWVDASGGLWGVGGMFDTLPLTSAGILTYYGTAEIDEVSP